MKRKSKMCRPTGRIDTPSGLIGFKYQDTITGTITGDGTSQTFVFSVAALLPGLNARTIVFKRIGVQIIPKSQSQLDDTVTAYYVPISSNGELVATQPFRLLSAVNPTLVSLNVDKLKRLAPGTVITMSSESTSSVLGVRFGLPPASGSAYHLRITSIVHMFPQTEPVVQGVSVSPLGGALQGPEEGTDERDGDEKNLNEA